MMDIMFQLRYILDSYCNRLFSQAITNLPCRLGFVVCGFAVFGSTYKAKKIKKGLGNEAGRGGILPDWFGVFVNTPSPKRLKCSNSGYFDCRNIKFDSKPKLGIAPAAMAIKTLEKFQYFKCLSRRAIKAFKNPRYVKILTQEAIKPLKKKVQYSKKSQKGVFLVIVK